MCYCYNVFLIVPPSADRLKMALKFSILQKNSQVKGIISPILFIPYHKPMDLNAPQVLNPISITLYL